MLHHRLLDDLGSSASLLFIEAIYGSGVGTVLRQWESRGGGWRGEVRLLFDARHLPQDLAAATRMFWASLGRRLEQELPPLPVQDELVVEAVLRHLQGIRRPIAIAIQHGDRISASTVDTILRVLEAGPRLLITGHDVAGLTQLAAQSGRYFSTIGERQVWLTREETGALLQEQGVDLSEEAVTVLHRASLGHPAMILTSLATLPVEVASGVITRDRVIAAFLAEEPLSRWPSEFADFLGAVVQLPRFAPAVASALSTREDAARSLRRLRELALGRMVWHPGLGQRVFRWNERIRLVIKESMPPRRSDEPAALARVLAAARAGRDMELLLCALIHGGELDQAESLLREEVWDLLPNAMAPLWAALERIGPLALLERPALLSARLRLSPDRGQSPVSVRAARRAGRLLADAASTGSPWSRVSSLAYAIEFALYAGERERLIDLFSRVRELIEDLVDSAAADEVGGREISELLLIADAVFRSGNAIPAAEIGRLTVQLLELDPAGLDPLGERVAFARRLILHDHRERGLEEPFDAEPLLAGAPFLWRDGDIVVTALIQMWGDFDDGDFRAADAHLGTAAHRVTAPEAWPLLMLMRAHLSLYRGAPGELEAFVSAYERSTLSQPGRFAQGTLSQMQRTTAYLSKRVGRPLPSPGFLPATPEPGRLFYPRTEFVVRLMEALYALRAERPTAARAELAAAVSLSSHRELGVYTLANASVAEVKALRDLAETVPGGTRLHLEKALLFAGDLHRSPVDLSERELEVLDNLREGATNPEMAQQMFVSVNTVKFHRANLMRKLEATSRGALLEAADKLGL